MMGMRCAVCGGMTDLQCDCIVPQGDEHHRMDSARRITFYARQYTLGNLQLLCELCHRRKTKLENALY